MPLEYEGFLPRPDIFGANPEGCGGVKNRALPGTYLKGGCWPLGKTRSTPMDKEHLKGAADKVKGAVKDAAGKATGDKRLEAEGKFDKAKGAAHSAVGDAKDALKDPRKG